jgi:hypothetical protein
LDLLYKYLIPNSSPNAFELRDMHGISKTKDQVMAIVVIILAVGTSGIAIWTNLNGSNAD